MSHRANDKVDARLLTGVSETALMTLYGRGYQAGRPDPIIDDPMATKPVESIDFDFEKFGRKGQEMALRSLAVDQCAIRYLTKRPKATVVALAEGRQTSFCRLNSALPDAQFHWVSVDLAPVIELRRRLLPHSVRITHLAQSALDYSWVTKVDSSDGVFVTAEGLLMYLQPQEALGLIAECAKRFPGGQTFLTCRRSLSRSSHRRGCVHPCATGCRPCRSACRCINWRIWRTPCPACGRCTTCRCPMDEACSLGPCSPRSGSSRQSRSAAPTPCLNSADGACGIVAVETRALGVFRFAPSP